MDIKIWIHKRPSTAEDASKGFTMAFQFPDEDGLIDEYEATMNNSGNRVKDLEEFIAELEEILIEWKHKQ